jgi:hypothetical protein
VGPTGVERCENRPHPLRPATSPLDGVTEPEQVDFLMKDGQIIKDERPRT